MPNRIIYESINTSASLANVSPQAELLFIHLSTKADDYGCFEADPRIVLGACFPLRSNFRVAHVKGWLEELAREVDPVTGIPLVELYEVNGKKLLRLSTFEQRQRKRASKPKYPLPTDSAAIRTHPHADDGLERERKRERESRTGLGNGGSAEPSASESTASPPEKEKPVTVDELADSWNEICVPLGLSAVREVRGDRHDKARRRLSEHPELEFWREVFAGIQKSKFLQGKSGKGDWKASFDFMIENETNANRIREGVYG